MEAQLENKSKINYPLLQYFVNHTFQSYSSYYGVQFKVKPKTDLIIRKIHFIPNKTGELQVAFHYALCSELGAWRHVKSWKIYCEKGKLIEIPYDFYIQVKVGEELFLYIHTDSPYGVSYKQGHPGKDKIDHVFTSNHHLALCCGNSSQQNEFEFLTADIVRFAGCIEYSLIPQS